MEELQKIVSDIRSGALSLREIPSLLISIIERKITKRYALSNDECGPAQVRHVIC